MVIFVVPAFNEAANIPELLRMTHEKMCGHGLKYRIILVNDGSTDRTVDVVLGLQEKFPVDLVNCWPNQGVGAAFRLGLSRALQCGNGNDIIVTKEADNTSDLDILCEMLRKISSGYDVALASCYAPEGKVLGTTLDRRVLSYVANFLIKSFFPIKGIHTYSSFYRAYRAEVLKRAFFAYEGRLISEAGFTCMVEMLINLHRLPIRIAEVPMVLRGNVRKGMSKMNRTRTIFGYLLLIGKKFGYFAREKYSLRQRYDNYSEAAFDGIKI